MKTHFSLFLLFAMTVQIAFAETPNIPYETSYNLSFKNGEKYEFSGEIYTIFNHSVGGWDSALLTLQGVRNLYEFSLLHSITRFGFISSYGGADEQFFGRDEINFGVRSDAGQHNLQFPNARAFLLAGGNLSLCLCEVFRDLIRGTSDHGQPLKMIIVSDATYDDKDYLKGLLPNGYLNPLYQIAGEKFALNQFIESEGVGDKSLAKYTLDHVLGSGLQPFCPGQNYYHYPNIDKSKFKFSVYNEDRRIAEFGQGQRRVELIFSHSKRLNEALSIHQVDRFYPLPF